MKEIEVKCPRCGKVRVLNRKTATDEISCPHCHYTMELDPKLKKKIKVLQYISGFFVIVILSFFMGLLQDKVHTAVMIVYVMVAGIGTAYIAPPIGNYLAYNMYTYTYVPKQELKSASRSKTKANTKTKNKK